MGAMSRTKGKVGEREIAGILADLTGWQVKRRVRQHDGDSDLEGIPGWSVEVKRHAAAPRASIATWWAQTVEQAVRGGGIPVLFFRADRDDWRAVWPASTHIGCQSAAMWTGYGYTVEGSIPAWAAVAADIVRRAP